MLGGLRWVSKVWETLEGWGGRKHPAGLPRPFYSSPKEVGDVIALSDIAPTTGAADRSQEPSPVGSRRGRVTPNLSHASSDADHGVSREDAGARVGDRDRQKVVSRRGGGRGGREWAGG